MKWLYDHGAQEDVRAPDNGGRTPLNTSLKHLDNTCRYSGSIKFPELRNMMRKTKYRLIFCPIPHPFPENVYVRLHKLTTFTNVNKKTGGALGVTFLCIHVHNTFKYSLC